MRDPHLPNFLIVGAAKCGTTSLSHALNQHKDIFISNPKEPKYLSYSFLKEKYSGPGDDFTKKKAIKTFEAYQSLFKKAKEHQIKGECSVDNLYYHEFVVPIIKETIGDPKIIIMLRNPANRAFSAYSHLIRDSRETLSFEKALKKEKERIDNGFEFIWAYKEASMYYESVKTYLENFSNVKVIVFEEFMKNKEEGLIDVLEFLECDTTSIQNIRFEQQNISGKPKKKWINRLLLRDSILKYIVKAIMPETKRQSLKQKMIKKNIKPIEKDHVNINKLSSAFKEDIVNLEKLLNIDLSLWRN